MTLKLKPRSPGLTTQTAASRNLIVLTEPHDYITEFINRVNKQNDNALRDHARSQWGNYWKREREDRKNGAN